MANLTKNTYTNGVATQTLVAAAAAGDAVQNYSSKDFLIARNGHATLPRTITLASQEQCNQGASHPKPVIVAALTTVQIELPGPAERWKNPTTGALDITYSDAAADITIGAFTRP